MSLISGLGSYTIDPSSLYQKHNNGSDGTSVKDEQSPSSVLASDHEDKISYPSEKTIQEKNPSDKSYSRNMNAYRQIMGYGLGNSGGLEVGSSVDIVV